MKTSTYLLTICILLLLFTLSAEAQWTTNGNGDVILSQTGDKVGIGFTNPTYKLEVLGEGRFTSGIDITNTNATLDFRRFHTSTSQSSIRFMRNTASAPSTYTEQGFITAFHNDLLFKAGINATSGSDVMTLEDDGDLNVNGRVTCDGATSDGNVNVIGQVTCDGLTSDGVINRTYSGAFSQVLQANGEEALFFNGDYFSWGFDANWNRWARPITIGNTLEPKTNDALVINDAREIAMVGNNSYIDWYTGANSNYASSSRSAFVGSNQVGAIFFESNLSSANIDGETGINFLCSDITRMQLDDLGYVGIGGAPDGVNRLKVFGDVCITGEMLAASDARFKKNISQLENATEKIMQLNPVDYEYRSEEFEELDFAKGKRHGFIAQEIQTVFPELVQDGQSVESTTGEQFNGKSVNYMELIPVLTKAIQEQQVIIEEQAKLIEEIQAQLK